ncbi:hypothetical protein [Streptomyces bugieae]|uniref:Tetratricopeptide repeat protein n=1 Tax=Streptomyces bugieae TaxID=3098223 RepID=A0ABU7NQY0_9ACTN|nr:hypothetical protein [Streptomyces sp. DSM 41528]
MDPELPVVRLCGKGMQAEAEGRAEVARELFQQAWDIAADDYEACIAAHYLALHQKSAEETLRWNQECLDRADRVADERVREFYPSLYLNMAHAYRRLGRRALAHHYFLRAAERVCDPAGGRHDRHGQRDHYDHHGQYGDWNRFAIAEGLRATADAVPAEVSDEVSDAPTLPGAAALQPLDAELDGRIRELLARWCARADLKALGLTLPAYLGHLGTEADRVRLRSALHMVHAARWLPADEQTELGAVVGATALR